MADSYKIAESIMQIFDSMKPDGTVVLPAFDNASDGTERTLSCKLIWTKEEAAALCRDISDLMVHFQNLSVRFQELDEMNEELLKTVLSKEELDIWFTYRPFFLYDVYYDQVQDIFAKEEMIEEAQQMIQKQAAGVELDEDERFVVNVYGHEYLDDYEIKELEFYRNIDNTESELRIGHGMFARNVVEGGTRILKSMASKVPLHDMEYLISSFVRAVIIHRFGAECIQIDVKS